MKKGFVGIARVYALTDLDDNAFYVGCTTNPLEERRMQHLGDARKNDPWENQKKVSKIRSLNYQIKIRELDSKKVKAKTGRTAQQLAVQLEEKWILRLRDLGYDLCNYRPYPKKEVQ